MKRALERTNTLEKCLRTLEMNRERVYSSAL